MKIDFNEEKHEYSCGGVKIPSVSEILAPLSAERYEDLNPWMLKAAAARGTAVHEACELIDYGAEPEEDPEIDGYLLAYQTFLMEHDVDWELVESIVPYYRGLPFDDENGELPIYCGTVDRFGLVDGEPAVLDIKTYASLSTDSQIAASCQTALYRDALYSTDKDQSKLIKRYVLHLKKDGTYRLVDLNKFDADHGFNGDACAWMLVDLWLWRGAAKKTVRKGKK